MNHCSDLRSRLAKASHLLALSAAVVFSLLAPVAIGQGTGFRPTRLAGNLTTAAPLVVQGTQPPSARLRGDRGRMPASQQLHGMSMVFTRCAAQQADLDEMLTSLYDRKSINFHKWLTPQQFGARFGMTEGDLEAAKQWLHSQGFAIERVSIGHDQIFFSGSIAQVEIAFHTEMHNYLGEDGERHFGPSSALSLPAPLAGIVQTITNIAHYPLRPMYVHRGAPSPAFTSGSSGDHFLSPGDLITIYDVAPVYSHGIIGAGQSIAIISDSLVNLNDIANFQNAAFSYTTAPPIQVMVPLSSEGNPAVPLEGAETEADLDLEWSSSMAPGATIYLVYPGGAGSYDETSALAYAIETDMAPIVSFSFGGCEALQPYAQVLYTEALGQQAAAQGQTLLAAAGDDGASGCFRESSVPSEYAQLSVSYPASSPWWTAVGGTEFNEDPNGTYWAGNGSQDVVSSALSYIPERVWNDDAATAAAGYPEPGAGGGGVSSLFVTPSWQASFPGMPATGFRNVPDIALASASGHDPLLLCSEDNSPQGAWQQGQQSSCTNGFRDNQTGELTVAGGTSFATPTFAGLLAVLNQSQGSAGQGLLNPTLYQLAADTTAYASAFHDITVGDNSCDGQSSPMCPEGAIGYSAGPGYDMASGLGSIDFANLVAAWPSTGLQPSYIGGYVSISPSQVPVTTVPQNTPIQIVGALHFQGGNGQTMTGTVSLSVDDLLLQSGVSVASNTASFTTTFGPGQHVVVLAYSGDSYYSPARTTVVLQTLPATATLVTPSAAALLVGASDTFAVSVSPSTGSSYANGMVNVLVDGQAFGSALTLNEGAASFTTTFATPGAHTVEADYLGDGSSLSPSTATATINVSAQATGTTSALTAATLTPVAGANDLLTIEVAASSGATNPTGIVNLAVDGQSIGTTPALVHGVASMTYAFSTAGTHTVVASYPAQGVFGGSTAATLTFSVTGASSLLPTTTSLNPSEVTSAIVGVANHFTVTVTPLASGTPPTGTISVTVDGTPATTATLAGGSAGFDLTFSSSGAHTVMASYQGDGAVYAPSSETAAVQVLLGGFLLSQGSLTLQAGSSGTVALGIRPQNGYTGTIAFKVTPGSNAPSSACYSIANATVSSPTLVLATLSVGTDQGSCTSSSSTSVARLSGLEPRGRSGWPQRDAGFTFTALGLLGCMRRRSVRLRSLGFRSAMALLLLLGAVSSVAGCASGPPSTPPAAPSTAAGTYTLTITGTDTQNASITGSAAVTLTVQ